MGRGVSFWGCARTSAALGVCAATETSRLSVLLDGVTNPYLKRCRDSTLGLRFGSSFLCATGATIQRHHLFGLCLSWRFTVGLIQLEKVVGGCPLEGSPPPDSAVVSCRIAAGGLSGEATLVCGVFWSLSYTPQRAPNSRRIRWQLRKWCK